MNDAINKAFIGFAKRAEKIDKESLVESFVNVGPLIDVLSTIDNQVLYGRRGTGKTHALVYLAESVKRKGDLSVYLDLRTIGSTGGIYSDQQIPIAERATRLLMDTLGSLHDE
jgi:Cdc6-like AAA superfamily ATPase